MAQEEVGELENLTSRLSKSGKDSDKKLIEAFALFSQETERLQSSYKSLKKDFNTANSQLNIKIAQLDLISHYLHSILNHISQGILFIDLSGVITTFNGQAERILEKDGLDVLFAEFWDHFEDEYFGFSISDAIHAKTAPETLFANLSTPSGELRELEIHTTFILQEDSQRSNESKNSPVEIIEGMIIVLRDRTEINRLRRLASRNDRMQELGEMAAMVAHEIRNPLGGIKGFASLLHRDLNETPQLQKMADHIILGANTLNRLVTHVLNYSRPIHLNLESTNLLTLCQDLYRHVEADNALRSDIIFTISAPPVEILLPVDKQLLQAAFLNLIMNAIQALPNGGKIELKLSIEAGFAILVITDNGVGISEDHFEKIFSPFFTTKSDGNGFGLSEAHKIIQAHDGIIEVDSRKKEGTSFTIKLPIKPYSKGSLL